MVDRSCPENRRGRKSTQSSNLCPTVITYNIMARVKFPEGKYFQKVGTYNNKHLYKYQKFVDQKILPER